MVGSSRGIRREHVVGSVMVCAVGHLLQRDRRREQNVWEETRNAYKILAGRSLESSWDAVCGGIISKCVRSVQESKQCDLLCLMGYSGT